MLMLFQWVCHTSSGPAALFGCKFLRSLSIPATEMVISGISGNSCAQPCGKSNLPSVA